jgi:hypothetical protein
MIDTKYTHTLLVQLPNIGALSLIGRQVNNLVQDNVDINIEQRVDANIMSGRDLVWFKLFELTFILISDQYEELSL